MKYILVTGASRGIGKDIALSFIKKGYFTFLISRNKNNLNLLENELQDYKNNFLSIACDVSNLEDVKSVFKSVEEITDKLDILVNSAGISKLTSIEDNNYNDWDSQININLNGTYYFSKEGFRLLKKSESGRIINIASVYGLMGAENCSAYCASKHAVIGLTKAMALDCAKYNITVNAICPGWVETDMFHNDMNELAEKFNIDKDILIEEEKAYVPTKHFTTTSEITDLINYLILDSAKNITGQAINISGGIFI